MAEQTKIAKKEFEGMRILVVEDNLLNQKIAEYILKGFGFTCTVASNGKKALEALKSGTFNLVLMDIQMPEMDGYETTTIIRKDLKLDIPVIATTGNSSGAERNKCIESGMTDYISKPLRHDELYELLAKYLLPDEVSPVNK